MVLPSILLGRSGPYMIAMSTPNAIAEGNSRRHQNFFDGAPGVPPPCGLTIELLGGEDVMSARLLIPADELRYPFNCTLIGAAATAAAIGTAASILMLKLSAVIEVEPALGRGNGGVWDSLSVY